VTAELNQAGHAAAAAARRAGDSPWIDRLARVGLAARGLVYILIAVLAYQVASGNRRGRADQKGAFQTLAQHGWGKAVLSMAIIGFFGYAIWLATDAVWGHRSEPARRKRIAARVESGAKVVFYVLLAILGIKIMTGARSSGGSETVTAKVLNIPGGQALVALAGAVVIGVAAAQAWRGCTMQFTEYLNLRQLSPTLRRTVVTLGKVGYIARGVVFGLIGFLVIVAAVSYDPEKARGFDAALRELAAQPYGPWLLVTIAVGLACFGVYSFAEARYRRL
jgi:hypothetical protein